MPTVDQLREALRQKNLDTKGRKAELEARLAAANASGESPGEDKLKAIEKQLADLRAELQAALPAGGGQAPAQLELDKLAAISDVIETASSGLWSTTAKNVPKPSIHLVAA